MTDNILTKAERARAEEKITVAHEIMVEVAEEMRLPSAPQVLDALALGEKALATITELEGVVREMAVDCIHLNYLDEWSCGFCRGESAGDTKEGFVHTASCPMNNPIVRELVGGE